MAVVLRESTDDQAAVCANSDVANSFIATTYISQATTLLNRGLYAEAEGYFREVLRVWPEHADTMNNLGTAVWRQGRVGEAELYHRRALALKPDDFAILNNLGNVLWEQGRLDQAFRCYCRPSSCDAIHPKP